MKEPLCDTAVVVVSELPNNSGRWIASTVEQLVAEVTDVLGFAFRRIPVFVEHNSPEAMGGCEETFDLDR